MGVRKDNLKALFSNTRTRVIIVFTMALLIIGVLIGFYKFWHASHAGAAANAQVAAAPVGIQSIPGAINPTAQYASLQEEQNLRQAQQALLNGQSAIPTIVRVQKIGADGSGIVGPQQGQGGVGFSTLAQEQQGGLRKSAWVRRLKDSQCSKAVMTEVRSQGAQLNDLKQGCTCQQLYKNGYPLSDLTKICACKELKAAGINAFQLKNVGYTAEQLRRCDFNACEMRGARFSAQQLKDAGFSDDELKGAGYTPEQIASASGIPAGISVEDIQKADHNPNNLRQLRNQGVSASALRRINGLTPSELKAAGYDANDLRNAGFTAAQLKAAGFTPGELRKAGYSAQDLLNAGFTPEALSQAGFSPDEIGAANAELPPGITANDVKKAGCSQAVLNQERLSGVSATTIRQQAGCSAKMLREAGFTPADLAAAGFNQKDIQDAAPVDDNTIRMAGCDATKLAVLERQGVSAARIRQLNGCSIQALKAAGFGADALLQAGFTPQELAAAGFTPQDIQAALTSPAAIVANLKKGNCNPDTLRAAYRAGISAADVVKLSPCDARALKAAGYSAAQLRDAGFTAGDLKNAGFTAEQLKAAGFNAIELKNAGFSPQELNQAGFVLPVPKPTAAVTPPPVVPAQPVTVVPAPATAVIATTPQAVRAMQAANAQRLQKQLVRQDRSLTDQRFQQRVQQRASQMQGAANQDIQNWSRISVQSYVSGQAAKETTLRSTTVAGPGGTTVTSTSNVSVTQVQSNMPQTVLIKTGDILFAILDTSVNSDEPGPILATIVSGPLKGAKLIGSFNLPSNSDKMVINFNVMSVRGAPRSTSISAFAIDPNTARTALSSRTDHHYLGRYGALFASSFLEGFGNAFQSADTTVTVGGTGGGGNVTVQNGINRSTLQNAIIGLSTVGKEFTRVIQRKFNRPTTVQVYSGTPIGVLFTQDVTSL